MKRVLILAAVAASFVPAGSAAATQVGPTGDESRIPSELCTAVIGSDAERILCSNQSPV